MGMSPPSARPRLWQASLPMDTGNASGEGTAAGQAEGGEGGEGDEDYEEGECADEEGAAQEVRLVPVDASEAEGGLDGALERLFQALSDGAALNPDEEDEGEEEEEGGFDMSGFHSAETFMGEEPQALSMATATPEHRKETAFIHVDGDL